MPEKFRLCVVGLGYIGLPTAAVVASRVRGCDVVGLDVNEEAVKTINRGDVHIVEPGLDMLVKGAVSEGRLRATTSVEPGDVFVIAVPTPFNEHYEPDLSYIEAAARNVAKVLRPGNLVILESTSPVGATEKMIEWMREERGDLRFPTRGENAAVDVHVAHCPERVLPGWVIKELVDNDRVVGGVSPACTEKAREFYLRFVRGECLGTDARTAEFVKLTENAFRDVNIAYANELSMICEDLEVDVWELIGLANRHPRVNILQPGCGVGGHCIAVDPWFIVNTAPERARLIRQAREVNDSKPKFVIEQVRDALAKTRGGRVACLGLAFKANIDDLRESPALEITKELVSSGIAEEIIVVEPHIQRLPDVLISLGDRVRLEPSIDRALEDSDLVVLLVDHRVFRDHGERLLSRPLIDTRGVTSGIST